MDKNALSYIGFQQKYNKKQPYLKSTIRKKIKNVYIFISYMHF